jgi:hypothetical protein
MNQTQNNWTRAEWATAVLAIAAGFWGSDLSAQAISAETITVDPNSRNTGTLTDALVFGGPFKTKVIDPLHPGSSVDRTWPSGVGVGSNRGSTGNVQGMDFFTPSLIGPAVIRMSLTNTGRLGVGTISPTRNVEVVGGPDVELGLRSTDTNGRLWTIQSSGTSNPDHTLDSSFQIIDRSAAPPGDVGFSRLKIDKNGTVSVKVLQIVGGSDIAEPFEISSGAVARGSVVVIDDKRPGELRISNRAYDSRVAGIISGAGGMNPGISLRQQVGTSGENVALTGRAYALADARGAPIRPGDLLTTSDLPGHCMKMIDRKRGRGAVLGKAMTGLDRGEGTILVLVSLQ